MEFEQNMEQGCALVELEEAAMEHKHDSLVPVLADSENTNSSCFDCSICFDSAYEPVVTLCGHLFCWPCIFKWLHLRSIEPVQTCPVCKANISEASLVPLYGRGGSRDEPGIAKMDLSVPPRPTAAALRMSLHGDHQLHPHRVGSNPSLFQHYYFHQPQGGFTEFSSSNVGGTVMAGLISPTLEILAELVRTRIWDMGLFTYRSSYSSNVSGGSGGGSGGGSHPRMRRHEMQLDKSLNRVSIFLFCCCMLCLLLF